ncbi:MAG: ATP-binding domain-containing protein [Candidatus Bathyarchaeota archaeon]|nr:ATP-binding domain-containing protein [Candidatus Bathyarchaeota archaeon]
MHDLKKAGIPVKTPKEMDRILRNTSTDSIIRVMEKIADMKPDISAYRCYTEALNKAKKHHISSSFADIIREFEENSEDNSATAFIQYVRSVSNVDFSSKDEDAVNILTIHKSKGLEFKVVFVTYLREYSFPKYKADLEEERRLFYVSLTRAMDQLHLIGSSSEKSRFIREVRHLLKSADSE